MTYLLDTNVCIQIMNRRSVAAAGRLALVPAHVVAVCSVVKAELWFGAARSANPARNRQCQTDFLAPYASLPFDDRAAEHYGTIRHALQAAGTPIGANDLLMLSPMTAPS